MIFSASINIIIIFLLAYAWLKRFPENGKWLYWISLTLKLASGLLLGYVYSTYYTDSDTFSFFKESLRIAQIAETNWQRYLHYLWSEKEPAFSGENRTLFFMKLVSVFTLITQGNYWITSLYFSFFSFAACWWLVSVVSKYFHAVRFQAMVAFLFFPSCIFWSAGIIKESTAIAMLCVLIGVFVGFWNGERFTWIKVVLILVATWVLWSLKYYYAAVFFPVALSALLTRWFVRERMRISSVTAYREFVLLMVLLLMFVFVVTFVHPNFYPQRMVEVVVENYEAFRDKSDPDKMVHFNNLKPELGSLVRHSPWALVSGLFRPFIWEATNVFSLFVSIENFVLLVLTVFSVRHFRTITNSPHRLLIFAMIVYCAALCIFLTLSAPNFGTYVRYRIGFLPLFVMLVTLKLPLERWFGKLFRL
ncbi:MAG: hypothetical protein KF845_05825 [Cyclobacteriaceae bacterium]|nr:hypothetical protein [Cyclobacteriaceae bacterium]